MTDVVRPVSDPTAPPGSGAPLSVADGAPDARALLRIVNARRARTAALLAVPVAVLVVVGLFAAWPTLFTSVDPIAGDPTAALQAPGAAHWFGTDATGRDMFARVVHGARQSLTGAVLAVAVGLTLGTAIGLVAGTAGGWVDEILMRLVDVLLSIPTLLLMLSVIILLGFGTGQAALAVGLAGVAAFARLSRAEVIRVRRTDYVEAAFAAGTPFLTVLRRHVLPNSAHAVLALAALQFGSAILALATLGFLGYGAPPPTPEWGLAIAEGRDYVATAWWLTTLPGLVVVATVLSANQLSAHLTNRSAA